MVSQKSGMVFGNLGYNRLKTWLATVWGLENTTSTHGEAADAKRKFNFQRYFDPKRLIFMTICPFLS